MNTSDPRFELIPPLPLMAKPPTEELADSSPACAETLDFRQAYVRYMNLDVALSAEAETVPLPETNRTPSRPRRNVLATPGVRLHGGAGVWDVLHLGGVWVCDTAGSGKKDAAASFRSRIRGNDAIGQRAAPQRRPVGCAMARRVPAENGVRPLQGQQMLRMEPILVGEQDEKHYSYAYQVLDLRSLPFDTESGAMEAQVTASFCALESEAKALYLIRVVALNEPPATSHCELLVQSGVCGSGVLDAAF